MNTWQLALFAGAGITGSAIAGRILYRSALGMYDELYSRIKQARMDKLDLARMENYNALQKVREIRPDERGRYPLLFGENGILRDPNNLRAFTLQAVIERWPTLERLDAIERRLIAMAGIKSPRKVLDQIEAQAEALTQWPQQVTLEGLLRKAGPPTLHRLALGITMQAGQETPVTGDLQDMVHVLVSGASGWGKSTLIEAMAKQLVLSRDCDLCFVDYGVNTFGMLADHAIYPIADTPGMAIALFRELIKELHRRRDLFKDYPRARSLDQFNQTTGQDLQPLVCFVDESATLFAQEGTKGPATELAQMGRKYGLGMVMAGTDFKATTLPTEASGNFGARIAMHLRPSLSMSLLGTREAATLTDKGRALAQLPGTPGLVQIQCPIVTSWDDLPPVRDQISLQPSPTPEDSIGDQAAEIIKLHREGQSMNQIQLALFGYTGGKAYQTVRQAIDQANTTTTGSLPPPEV